MWCTGRSVVEMYYRISRSSFQHGGINLNKYSCHQIELSDCSVSYGGNMYYFLPVGFQSTHPCRSHSSCQCTLLHNHHTSDGHLRPGSKWDWSCLLEWDRHMVNREYSGLDSHKIRACIARSLVPQRYHHSWGICQYWCHSRGWGCCSCTGHKHQLGQLMVWHGHGNTLGKTGQQILQDKYSLQQEMGKWWGWRQR